MKADSTTSSKKFSKITLKILMHFSSYLPVGGLVGWLVGFISISTIIGYLMSNPLYIYIVNS